MANERFDNAKKNKNDEFYTRLEDIEKEHEHYKDFFKDAAQANLVKIVFRLSNDGDILLTLKEDIGKLYI